MKEFGTHTRDEVDAELLADQIRTSNLYGHDADQFESIEQMTDFIRENLVEILFTEHRESALNHLISDLKQMKKNIYDIDGG